MGKTSTDQCIDFEQAWGVQAILELKSFIKRFTTRFMKRHRLPVQNSKTAMLNRIRREIHNPKKSPTFKDLIEYLDELKMWGRQCIVCYTLRNARKTKLGKTYLGDLRNPDYIEKRLGKQRNRFNNHICRWESNRPFLSEVKHNYDAKKERGELSFKWVQTRRFTRMIGNHLQIFRERSVNFFIVNLKDGSAQLRIQVLPNNSLTTLTRELRTYKKEIEKLLGPRHFTSVSLKPAMKELLVKRVLPITHWSVNTRGGNMHGDNAPFFLWGRLVLFLRRATPRIVRVYWKCQQKVGNKTRGRLHFALESKGNVDVIIFRAMTDKTRVDYLISKTLTSGKRLPKTNGNGTVPTPAPKFLNEGLRGKWLQGLEKAEHEKAGRPFVELAILGFAALIRILFEFLTSVLADSVVAEVGDIPFIVSEAIAYVLAFLAFYGVRKVGGVILNKSMNYIISGIEYKGWHKMENREWRKLGIA
jgi:hypothetical protein